MVNSLTSKIQSHNLDPRSTELAKRVCTRIICGQDFGDWKCYKTGRQPAFSIPTLHFTHFYFYPRVTQKWSIPSLGQSLKLNPCGSALGSIGFGERPAYVLGAYPFSKFHLALHTFARSGWRSQDHMISDRRKKGGIVEIQRTLQKNRGSEQKANTRNSANRTQSKSLNTGRKKSSELLESIIQLKAAEWQNTAMGCLTTFPSVTDCVYNGGPMRLQCSISTAPFLPWDMFRFTNAYHRVTIACSILSGNALSSLVMMTMLP